MPHQAGIWLEADDRSFSGDMTLSIRAESTEAVQATLKLANETDDTLSTGDVVGSMRYSPPHSATEEGGRRAAAISFEAMVPANIMGSILRHARSGRPPQKVWLDIRGLGYRDGPRRKSPPLSWPAHEERPALPITDMSLEFPHRRQTEFKLVHAEAHSEDPTASEKARARALNRLDPVWIRLAVRVGWVVWILLAVIVAWQFWFGGPSDTFAPFGQSDNPFGGG